MTLSMWSPWLHAIICIGSSTPAAHAWKCLSLSCASTGNVRCFQAGNKFQFEEPKIKCTEFVGISVRVLHNSCELPLFKDLIIQTL